MNIRVLIVLAIGIGSLPFITVAEDPLPSSPQKLSKGAVPSRTVIINSTAIADTLKKARLEASRGFGTARAAFGEDPEPVWVTLDATDEGKSKPLGWLELVDIAGTKDFKVDRANIKSTPSGKSVVPFVRLGLTAETHGIIRKKWKQKDTVSVELLEVQPNLYYIVDTQTKVETKSPWGDWNVADNKKVDLNEISEFQPGTLIETPVD